MSLKDLQILSTYVPEEDPVNTFYGPSLSRAKYYIRAAGYFRSTLLELIPEYLHSFVVNGGKIQLICSPDLTENDVQTIFESTNKRNQLINFEVDQLLNDLKTKNSDKIFASLIKFDVLEIKFVFKKRGIFHQKWGVLTDDLKDKVYFSGSVNETYAAWSNEINSENLETRCSWKSEDDLEVILKKEKYFLDIWENKTPGISAESMSLEVKEKIELRGYPQQEEFVKELANIDKIRSENNNINHNPSNSISLLSKARKHQKEAIEYWKNNNFKAMFKHATGSGKTFTGILTLEEFFKYYNLAIVMVPSLLLQKQWQEEIRTNLPNIKIILAGGGETQWVNLTSTHFSLTSYKFIVISILNTAIKDKFLEIFCNVKNTFILVDEVHSIGAPSFTKILESFSSSNFRLGISATPERYDEGFSKIEEYFGKTVESCIYNIKDGIADGYLSEYQYYNNIVNLTEDELSKWQSLTRQIITLRNKKNKDFEDFKKIENLIFLRSSIAQNAQNKIPQAVDIIRKNYVSIKQDRFLVFCSGIEQLDILGERLAEHNIEFLKYYSALEEDVKKETLKSFYNNGGIILSIKCLDEGVDIPKASKALILASSQNSRQFIQRRGRVLRISEGKLNADIFDILINIDKDKPNAYFEKELLRAITFSIDANNCKKNLRKLEKISIENDIDFDSMLSDLNAIYNHDDNEIEINEE